MSDNRAYGATNDEKPPPAYYPDTNDGQIAASGYDATPPPTYTQTQNEAPPPSYDSIFGEIRAAQRNAEGRGHFLKSVCEILLNTSKLFSVSDMKRVQARLLSFLTHCIIVFTILLLLHFVFTIIITIFSAPAQS